MFHVIVKLVEKICTESEKNLYNMNPMNQLLYSYTHIHINTCDCVITLLVLLNKMNGDHLLRFITVSKNVYKIPLDKPI